MPCQTCPDLQTFVIGERYLDAWLIDQKRKGIVARLLSGGALERDVHQAAMAEIIPARGEIIVVQFVCIRCQASRHRFMFQVTDDGKAIAKVGQSPPWSITPPKNVASTLGTHLEDYKKGLVCESQGYGIGAFAYFRRIVENVIAGLLRQVEELIAEDGEREKYHSALENLKDSHSAEGRIQAVKDMLPASLRRGGINPLDIIYSALSSGLHAETDEACLDQAVLVKASLVYLIDQLAVQQESAKAFAASIAGIKEKVAKEGKRRTDPK
jgi:hypothetical protein